MIPRRLMLCVLLMTMAGYHVTAETYDNRAALRASVLKGYQTDIRPLNDQSQALNISIKGAFYKILSVDAVRGSMTVVVSFGCYWYDEKITWNPSDYNGTSTIQLYKDNVWIPHLALGNPIKMKVFDEDFMQVRYTSDGLASIHCGDVIEMMCQFNIEYWPFDEQECVMEVFAYDQLSSDVQLVNISAHLNHIVPNGEWTLIAIDVQVVEVFSYSSAMFKIKLKRQSIYYVLQIIGPLLGIATLNPLVFLLPSESGERVSYSTTILLSITVFLSIVDESIPKTSNPLPLVVLLMSIGLFMGLATTTIVILNLYIYHRDDEQHPVTGGFRRLVHLYSKLKCNARAKSEVVPMKIQRDREKDSRMLIGGFGPEKPEITTSNIYRKEDEGQKNKQVDSLPNEQEDVAMNHVTWKHVSYTIDKVALIALFGLLAIVCSVFVGFLVIAPDN